MDRLTFRQLFHALPSPHMILDADLRYAAANPAYEAATLRTEAELLGRRIDEAFPNDGEAGERLMSSLHRVLETGKPDTLAYIPYAIPRPQEQGGGIEERYWTAIHSPLLDQAGHVVCILQNTVDITEIVRLREAASVPFRMLPGELDLVQRAREAEAAIHDPSRSDEMSFRRLFEEAPTMVAVLHGQNHVFTFANAFYRRFVGDRPLLGMTVRDAFPEIDGQGFYEMLDQVFATGAPIEMRSIAIRLARQEGGVPEEVFIDLSYRPIRDDQDRTTGIFVQATDQTEAVLAKERQRLLIDELNHRVKNTLSAVQSIARQSFRGRYDPAIAQESFDARVQALAKAHDVLSDRHWESAELRTILMQELSIYDRNRVVAGGPLTRLKPKAAIAFAMVFHELASNAVKYGALSVPGGDLDVSWVRPATPDGSLLVEWRESGAAVLGGTVEPAFGLKMLQRIITGELDGVLDLAFRENGLICRFEVPLLEVEDFAGAPAG